MHQVVVSYPILLEADFITAVEQFIAQRVVPAQRPAFQQRLHWLQQMAKE